MKSIFVPVIAVVLLAGGYHIAVAEPVGITMHKQAGCMCCDAHADILEDEGFVVEIVSHQNLKRFKQVNNIPPEYAGCHTMYVQDYLVEGHVPGEMIARLLAEKPDIRGISLPGMPSGTPGMPGERSELLDVYVINEGDKEIFDRF